MRRCKPSGKAKYFDNSDPFGQLEKSCSSCSSFEWTFALDTGNTQQSVTIKLRVRDDEYNWDSRTITYTVR